MTIPQAIIIARATTSTLWTMMKKDPVYWDHSPDHLREAAAEVLAAEVERLRGLVEQAAKCRCDEEFYSLPACCDSDACGVCACRKERDSWTK